MINKKMAIIAVAVVVLSVLGGLAFCNRWLSQDTKSKEETNTTVKISKEMTIDEQVEAIVSSMTYKEKLGQMVIMGIQGTELTDDAAYMMSQYHIGGVTLFDRNLESAEQTAALTKALQKSAKNNAGQQVPLFIAIDEEGGIVARGKSFIECPPAQEEIGNTKDASQAEYWAKKTGSTLKELGINVNFAPVADVGSNDTRSFSKDPDTVAQFVSAAAKGYASINEMYALKHFPGIGRGTVDSHQDISSIEISKEELKNTDLKPFQEIIRQQGENGFFIMVSHLKYPQLDPDNAASQSRAIMTDLLRKEMGYNGLIITDDLEMGAVAKYGSYRALGVKAVKSGADIVLMCHEYDHVTELYLGLLEAYENGELDKDQIDASVRRIVKAKLMSGITY